MYEYKTHYVPAFYLSTNRSFYLPKCCKAWIPAGSAVGKISTQLGPTWTTDVNKVTCKTCKSLLKASGFIATKVKVKMLTVPEKDVVAAMFKSPGCASILKDLFKGQFSETYHIGQRLKIHGYEHVYILAHIGANNCVLINTETGNTLDYGSCVDNVYRITEEELKLIAGGAITKVIN